MQEPPKSVNLVLAFEDGDCFVKLDDDTKLAKRENGKWLQLHPNWIISTSAGHGTIAAEWIPDAGQA